MAVIKGGDKARAAIAKIVSDLSSNKKLRVGFLANAKYPNGTPVAMVAAIHNYGAPRAGIPPRPFFTNMVKQDSNTWPKVMEANLKRTGNDVDATLMTLGLVMKEQVQESIRQTNSPPLAPATIKRKGFSKPLIDTSHMLNSVDYEVI